MRKTYLVSVYHHVDIFPMKPLPHGLVRMRSRREPESCSNHLFEVPVSYLLPNPHNWSKLPRLMCQDLYLGNYTELWIYNTRFHPSRVGIPVIIIATSPENPIYNSSLI